MKAFWNPIQLAHAPHFFLQRGLLRRNFETPERAMALLDACRRLGFEVEQPPDLDRASLTTVHTEDYLDFLRDGPAAWEKLDERGPEMVANIHPTPEMLANGARVSDAVIARLGWYTADTACPIDADTWPAASAAAAGAVAAAEEAAAGRHAYALNRPPGHHAYPARAGGHCYLNGAALAAEHLRARGASRVGVLDIDSHHGNGTQGCFWERGDIAVASVHGDPSGYYPWFVGYAEERGDAAGAGHNHNFPLPRGTPDGLWLATISAALAALGPVDALVVSLGFDASADEPLGYLAVTADGFARAGELVRGFGRPTALIQEGGYNLDEIGGLLERFTTSMLS